MRHHMIFSLAFVLACSGGSKELEPGSGLDNRASRSPTAESALLSQVDADTVYVYASLDPLPESVVARAMKALQDASDPLYQVLDMAGEVAFEDPDERLFYALAVELRGKLNMSGFRSIGIDLGQPLVIHAVGILPVLRIRLAGPDRLRTFLEGVATRAGTELPSRAVGTQTYWSFPVEDKLVVAVGIQGPDLVIALAPYGRPEPTLERAFGLVAPRSSLARSGTLEHIRETHHITTNMVGYVDIERAWAYLGDEASDFDRAQRSALGGLAELHIPSACMSEGSELVSHMPRLVMGYRSFDARASRAYSSLEISAALGREFGAMLKPYAWLENKPSGQPLLQFSAGIDVRALATSLDALTRTSWRCPALAQASDALAELTGQMATPPFGSLISGVIGFRVSIEDLIPKGNGMAEIRGHAIIEHRQPESLLSLMNAMLGLPNVTDGAPPVQMPIPLPQGQQTLWVARSGTSLILSMGEGSHARARELASARVSDARPAMTVAYDEFRMYQLAEKLPWLYEILDDDDNRELDDEASLELARRVDAALADSFTYGAVWFRERAIEVESVTVYAPAEQ